MALALRLFFFLNRSSLPQKEAKYLVADLNSCPKFWEGGRDLRMISCQSVSTV